MANVITGDDPKEMMIYRPYNSETSKKSGWAGSFSIKDECVGFLGNGGEFVSMLRAYNIEHSIDES